MNWRGGEGYIQRNTLEEKHDEIQWLNTANFEWQFSKCREATWDNTLAISRGQEREEGKKKKERGKKKKKREVRKDDNNILYFLSFSFLFLSLFSSFLDLPFLSLCRRDRKGKERELGERKERKKERKGKEREFIAVIFPCSPFFTFYFPFSPFFFFLSSLSLASLTRQACCHMSFFKHSEAVSQKW